MKQYTIMIKPASSGCNLRCRYCFYNELAALREVRSYGMMPLERMREMLCVMQRQLSPGDQLTFIFQGGEPTLAGLAWFQAFTELCDRWDSKITVRYALQTNATTLDDAWCRYLAAHRYLVGVSLDLLPQCHDDARRDAFGAGTYQKTLRALERLSAHHVDYNVLCTLTRQLARHPQQVWHTIKQQNLSYVQFTPCLDALDALGTNPYALTPQRFAQFYNQLFPLWLADVQAGQYRSIKLFDDVISLLAFGVLTSCGLNGKCQPQLVVEADGSVYPCDFYCLDAYRLGSIYDTPLDALLDAARRSPAQQRGPLPKLCSACPYLHFCGGNCKRMQRQITCTEHSSTCGYREFLSANGAALRQLAQALRAAQR